MQNSKSSSETTTLKVKVKVQPIVPPLRFYHQRVPAFITLFLAVLYSVRGKRTQQPVYLAQFVPTVILTFYLPCKSCPLFKICNAQCAMGIDNGRATVYTFTARLIEAKMAIEQQPA